MLLSLLYLNQNSKTHILQLSNRFYEYILLPCTMHTEVNQTIMESPNISGGISIYLFYSNCNNYLTLNLFLSHIYWIENALNVNSVLCYFKSTNTLYVVHCFKLSFELYHTFKYLHTTVEKIIQSEKRLVDNLIDIFYNKKTLKQT